MQVVRILLVHPLAVWFIASACAASEPRPPTAEQRAFFESKIRPVLVEHCYSCHSAEAKELKGSLLVDHRAGLLTGGDSGPAVVPGKPEESLLLAALKYESYEMPPDGKLPPEVIANFERWIAMGAPDPRIGETALPVQEINIEQGRQFWSFRPIARPNLPQVNDTSWSHDDVDAFLLARLEAQGLAPAADTDRATWLRRVTFDLIGLPPSPQEIDAFIADESPGAFEKVVDRLLESPHFGERWGRHWLDVARFAESSGGGRSLVFKDAWRYRDYVIKSFNDDKPLDEFIIEQIAGDLLPHASPQEEHDHLVATAYLLLGAHNYEEQDKQQLEMDVVDEQLDTIGRGLLGMTLACARCHDHKFDPIPTTDYYALAGILRSTDVIVHENVSNWKTRPLPMTADEEVDVEQHEAKVAKMQAELAAAKKADPPQTPTQIKALEKKLKQLTSSGPTRPETMAVADAETIADCQVCVRGSVRYRGPAVPRGMLQVATLDEPPPIPAEESGRRELAHWIASPDNPLTARVYVNRAWHYLFGAGLVRTLDNFGTTGEQPSHPELLDFLAGRFVDQNWSTKELVRALVLTRAYRMSTTHDARAAAVDPENRLLWRMNTRRLDAESLRDAMLVVSGRLDLAMGGPNILDSKALTSAGSYTPTEYGYQFLDFRRSVYTPAFRNRVHELFEVFDFANYNAAVAERSVTTVAPQALWMLNSPFVMDQARAAAERALVREDASESQRVELAFREALGRRPTDAEAAIAMQSIEGHQDRVVAWEQLFQALLGCLDFRYLN
ncbi:MAG: PSD1 and planctomycete cytochrome C domain-containing protein [Pirellulales bacterium]